jgi:hypothetical protein
MKGKSKKIKFKKKFNLIYFSFCCGTAAAVDRPHTDHRPNDMEKVAGSAFLSFIFYYHFPLAVCK